MKTVIDDLLAEEKYLILIDYLRRLSHKQRLVVVLRLLGDLLDDDIISLLVELGWADEEAKAVAPLSTGKPIQDIIVYTQPLGINTVGGVGNLLNAAKEALKRCFDER